MIFIGSVKVDLLLVGRVFDFGVFVIGWGVGGYWGGCEMFWEFE